MTTKKKYIQHNKQCFACGQEKAPGFLGYDIKTLKTYCLNKCKNKAGIPPVELIPATNEDLISGIVGHYSKEDEEAIMGLLGKVASTRLRPAHILHIMKVAEMEGLPSIQATILNVIESDMASRSMDDVELESFGQGREETYEELAQYEEVAKEIGGMPEPPNIKAINEALVKKMEPIQATINEKPVEPVKEEEEDNDNPFEF